MQKRWTVAPLALCWAAALAAVNAAHAGPVDQTPWNTVLQRYVDDNGRVAYRQLKAEDADELTTYLSSLASVQIDQAVEREQLAFWINAYNAMIVAAILDGYSAENTFKRYGIFKTYKRVLAGEKRSPDEVEHSIIRPHFHDARTHFALVCASSSCPFLRREAYVADRLDEQLADQGRRFLDNPTRNHIDPTTGRLELSQIFNWFKDDFTRNGTLADFLTPFVNADQAKLLHDKQPSFLDYDWTMNAQPGQRP